MSKPPRTRNGAERDLAATLILVEELKPALENNDRSQQNQVVRRLLDLGAPMGEQWQALARMAARNGETSLAREAIDRFVEAQGNSAIARYLKASVLEQLGAHPEAYALICSLPPDVPDRASYAYSRGTMALFVGETRDAREQLELAIRLQPDMGPAWLSLAIAADLAAESEVLESILAVERDMERVDPVRRAPYYYALGQALATQDEHAKAFAAFERGGRDVLAATPYRRDADLRGFEEALRGFDSATIADLALQQSEPTHRAIFVTGLPRSGTTLIEHALTCHSTVSDGGEINLLFQLVREIGGQSAEAIGACFKTGGAGQLARLWHRLLDERFPGSSRVVDKSLNAPRFMGLAASALPEAPLVWVTREPLDQAWSCFRTYFRGGQQWSCDLEDIAYHFRLEEELLRRWQDMLGDRLLVVPFEEMVGDFPDWITRIAAHCGLEPEPGMLAPHENERSVSTASVMQVRRPVNRSGVDSSKPYREFLSPFLEAYAN